MPILAAVEMSFAEAIALPLADGAFADRLTATPRTYDLLLMEPKHKWQKLSELT